MVLFYLHSNEDRRIFTDSSFHSIIFSPSSSYDFFSLFLFMMKTVKTSLSWQSLAFLTISLKICISFI